MKKKTDSSIPIIRSNTINNSKKNIRLKLNLITKPKSDHLLELQQKELLCKQLFKTFKKLHKQVKVLTTFILIAISLETLLQVLCI